MKGVEEVQKRKKKREQKQKDKADLSREKSNKIESLYEVTSQLEQYARTSSIEETMRRLKAQKRERKRG